MTRAQAEEKAQEVDSTRQLPEPYTIGEINLEEPLPDKQDARLMERLTATARKTRSSTKPEAVYEQACRQRWRAMLLYVKAILEAIENGVTTLDEALLSGIVLPGGTTFGQWATPQLDRIALEGRMPALLPGEAS